MTDEELDILKAFKRSTEDTHLVSAMLAIPVATGASLFARWDTWGDDGRLRRCLTIGLRVGVGGTLVGVVATIPMREFEMNSKPEMFNELVRVRCAGAIEVLKEKVAR